MQAPVRLQFPALPLVLLSVLLVLVLALVLPFLFPAPLFLVLVPLFLVLVLPFPVLVFPFLVHLYPLPTVLLLLDPVLLGTPLALRRIQAFLRAFKHVPNAPNLLITVGRIIYRRTVMQVQRLRQNPYPTVWGTTLTPMFP